MEYILFTDLHLGIHGNNSIWLDKSIELAEEMASFAKRQRISKIIFAGDFFNDRRSLNTRTIDYAHKFLDVLKDLQVYMIIGNHDTYFKNTNEVHSLTMFKSHKNVTVVEKKLWLDNNMCLVSWAEELPEEDVEILIGHFEVNGFVQGFSGGREAEDFKKYEMVLSGHFHTPMKRDNIQYVGSCMPFTFADVNSPRGYYLLNSDTKELDFFEFKGAPKYVIVDADGEIDPNQINNNVVKLVFSKELGSSEEEKTIAIVQTYEPLLLQTEFKMNSESEDGPKRTEYEDREITSNNTLFMDYVDKLEIPNHLNKKLLKGIINSMI